MKQGVNQLKMGSILSYAQMALSIIVQLAYTPVMIRLLGQSEYGLYNTVASTISMLSILSLGFNSSYIRYYAKYQKDKDDEAIYKLNGLFLIIFSVIGVIALACGLFLSYNLRLVFDEGLTAGEYKIAKILMLLLTANLAIGFPMSVFANIISAHERFVFLKLLGMVKTVVSPLVTLPLLLLGYRSIAMVTVTLGLAVLVDGVYFVYVKKVLKQRFVFKNFEKGLFKSLFAYTGFIAINLIVDQINWNIDKLLLGRFKGTTAVAVYSVGYALYQFYMMFSTAISGVLGPKIHKIVNESSINDDTKNKKLTNLFIKVGRLQFFVLGLVSLGFIFFGRYFIILWAGNEYKEAYYVALLLMIPSTASLIQNIGIEIRRAKNKHKIPSLFLLATAIVNLICSIVLIQKYGTIGAVVGTAISLIVNRIMMNIYYHKVCKINLIAFWLDILKTMPAFIFPILIGVGFTYLFSINNLMIFVIGIILLSISYIISIYILGLNKEEKNLIKQLLKKIKIKKGYDYE